MNFLDFFAGIGGFRLGMEAAGHKCVGWVESDPKCERCKKYTKHVPSEKRNVTLCTVCGKEKTQHARFSYEAIHDAKGEWTAYDITTVSDSEWRSFRGTVDVICGGFPCQAFSLAGKRGGFQDARGTLFFEITRAAKQIKPSLLFLENVKGLLSHDKGQTFTTILAILDELGYDAEWQVLNSKDFGVPQNRERVFIIGHLRGTSRGEIFPINGTYELPSVDIIDIEEHKQPKTIKIRENTKKGYVEAEVGDGIRLDHPKGTTGRGRIQKQMSPTLTTSCQSGVIKKDFRIRRLTPLEYWRLQGFPDDAFDKAKEVNSDSQLYKQAGNSVTVNVIYEIAKRLHF